MDLRVLEEARVVVRASIQKAAEISPLKKILMIVFALTVLVSCVITIVCSVWEYRRLTSESP